MILVRFDLNEPAFAQELEVARREFEREIFHTDETWSWAWKEFRLDLPGERYQVAVTTTGYYGTLVVEGNGTLRFFTEGAEYSPDHKISDYWEPLVGAGKPCKKARRTLSVNGTMPFPLQRLAEIILADKPYIVVI